ncbi:MAG TPA: hypothetical protein VFB38_06195 [Chthonomonadaceae bacterium]|nr:hypothetical protein [Chthonomonadaceae bacterium]
MKSTGGRAALNGAALSQLTPWQGVIQPSDSRVNLFFLLEYDISVVFWLDFFGCAIA